MLIQAQLTYHLLGLAQQGTAHYQTGLITDLLRNDYLSPCKMKLLTSMLLSSYIILPLSLYRLDSLLLYMQQMLFLP